MVPYDEPIYGFSGEKVSTHRYIDLYTIFREASQTKTIPIYFFVVDAPTSNNVILGRPSFNTLGAVVSIPHLAMKFLSPSGDILTIYGDQRLARECYIASLRPRVGRDARIELVDNTVSLELSNGRTLKLGTDLQQEQCHILVATLIANTNLFSWSVADLPSVDPHVVVHKLSIYK